MKDVDKAAVGEAVVETRSLEEIRSDDVNGHSPKDSLPLIHTMLSGAFAGGLADTVMHPFDTVKTRLQAQVAAPYRYTGMLHAFRTILAQEGIRGLYGGLGATMYSAIPATAVYFVVYETVKANVLPRVKSDLHSFVYLSAGATGEAVASLFSVPLEVFIYP
eukprot:TRINITY_DN6581_c0_g1_i1.p1 TRINITY_DN6581_c0_g1~~TRINITY_DN6581_c0_g1_i1.p1  ORF type:complete len:162 (-),score=31.34 TRINITY_DN6581_c0_g1_i1:174-659(-)